MKKHIKYIREKEWSMGNGQCPECYGCEQKFDSINSLIYREEGHKTDCILAEMLLEENEEVVYEQLNIEKYKTVEENFKRFV